MGSFPFFPSSQRASCGRERKLFLFSCLRKQPFVAPTSKLRPRPTRGHRGLDSWVERNRWLHHYSPLSPSRSGLQNRAWGLLSKVLQATRGNASCVGCDFGMRPQSLQSQAEPSSASLVNSAHRLLQQNVHADGPCTSSLPKLQIQSSQTDSSSWKSLYIPTLTLCRQEQFQSCLLSELLTNSEPGSAPGVASFCWFVLGTARRSLVELVWCLCSAGVDLVG